jgi:hypothetical protein
MITFQQDVNCVASASQAIGRNGTDTLSRRPATYTGYTVRNTKIVIKIEIEIENKIIFQDILMVTQIGE